MSGLVCHEVLLKSDPGGFQRRAARMCLEPKTPVGWEGRGGGHGPNETAAAELPWFLSAAFTGPAAPPKYHTRKLL